MWKLFKYELRGQAAARAGALAPPLALGLAALALGRAGFFGREGGAPTAAAVWLIVLMSLSIALIVAVAAVCDTRALRRFFGGPEAYAEALAPVAPWKRLAARALTITALDLASMAWGVAWLLWFLESPSAAASGWVSQNWWSVAAALLTYLIWTLICFLALALRGGPFFRSRARLLLGWLGAAAAFYALSWLGLALLPFAAVQRVGALILLSVYPASGAGVAAFLAVLAAQAAALFGLSAKLLERGNLV